MVSYRWDSEADRRRSLRTEENYQRLKTATDEEAQAETERKAAKDRYNKAVKNNALGVLSPKARSANNTYKAAKEREKKKELALAEAKTQYPDTLESIAQKFYMAAGIFVAVLGLGLWFAEKILWPTILLGILLGALGALHKFVLKVGRSFPRPEEEVPEGLSAEEHQLMKRLDPAEWKRRAPERGLEGTLSSDPKVTKAGIEVMVRMENKWTLAGLKAEEDRLRALLQVKDGTRMKISSGPRGDWAKLKFLTRRATDGDKNLEWSSEKIPDGGKNMSLGVDTETGEEVIFPLKSRTSISGASGSGKSWLVRSLMAVAHTQGDIIFLDGKGEEANIWRKVCRVAVKPKEIFDMLDAVYKESDRRAAIMEEKDLSVWNGKQLTVIVDEGQVILALLSGDKRRIQNLVEISSLGRSRGIVLWWVTQYPTVSGANPGMHQLISANMDVKISLRVARSEHARVALGDDAYYGPEKLRPREDVGHCYMSGHGPSLIRGWRMPDPVVRSLEPSVWTPPAKEKAEGFGSGEPSGVTTVRISPEKEEEPTGKQTNKDRVHSSILIGATSQAQIVEWTGINKGTVSSAVRALIAEGEVVKSSDGKISPVE